LHCIFCLVFHSSYCCLCFTISPLLYSWYFIQSIANGGIMDKSGQSWHVLMGSGRLPSLLARGKAIIYRGKTK
jgi:hypothetical protein